MRPTTTTHRFTQEELDEMKEKTGKEDDEKVLRAWAKRKYPLNTASYIYIREVNTEDEGGEISIDER